jgi:hypothetical protein
MPFYLNWRKRIGLALTSNEGAPTMNQLRTAIDVLKVELVTEEIVRINREVAVRAEVAREIDDFVRALNQQHPSGRLDAGNSSNQITRSSPWLSSGPT